MVSFVNPAYSDHPTGTDETARPEGVTDPDEPGQYRRQRVAYLDSDDNSWSGSGPNMYANDWSTSRKRRHRARRSGRTKSVLIAVSLLSATVGGFVAVGGTDRLTDMPLIIDAAFLQGPDDAVEVPRAQAGVAPQVSASAKPSAAAAPSGSAKATPKASKSTRPPEPIAGLNQTQMNNAVVIVEVARKRKLPRRAMQVALMTGLQESSLRNLANTTIPASLRRPHEGTGDDFDSLGVFQQRPSQGWGSVKELMNPTYAADVFYDRLLKVDDWEDKDFGEAAQAVQRSALPDAYDKHEERATKLIDTLL